MALALFYLLPCWGRTGWGKTHETEIWTVWIPYPNL